jgi:hypothetical protein
MPLSLSARVLCATCSIFSSSVHVSLKLKQQVFGLLGEVGDLDALLHYWLRPKCCVYIQLQGTAKQKAFHGMPLLHICAAASVTCLCSSRIKLCTIGVAEWDLRKGIS